VALIHSAARLQLHQNTEKRLIISTSQKLVDTKVDLTRDSDIGRLETIRWVQKDDPIVILRDEPVHSMSYTLSIPHKDNAENKRAALHWKN